MCLDYNYRWGTFFLKDLSDARKFFIKSFCFHWTKQLHSSSSIRRICWVERGETDEAFIHVSSCWGNWMMICFKIKVSQESVSRTRETGKHKRQSLLLLLDWLSTGQLSPPQVTSVEYILCLLLTLFILNHCIFLSSSPEQTLKLIIFSLSPVMKSFSFRISFYSTIQDKKQVEAATFCVQGTTESGCKPKVYVKNIRGRRRDQVGVKFNTNIHFHRTVKHNKWQEQFVGWRSTPWK